MAQFIDHGSPTSTTHTESEIGEYDQNDDFIDETEFVENTNVPYRPFRRGSSGHNSRALVGVRDTSPLFVPSQDGRGRVGLGRSQSRGSNTSLQWSRASSHSARHSPYPGPSERRRGIRESREGSRDGFSALPSRASSVASTSTDLVRPRRMVRDRPSPAGSLYSWPTSEENSILGTDDEFVADQTKTCLCNDIHGNPDCPRHRKLLARRERLLDWRNEQIRLGQCICSDERPDWQCPRHGQQRGSVISRTNDAERVSTPDPFQMPDHLNSLELKGAGVAGKRLGGKPRWSSRFFLFTFAQSGYDWPWEQFVARVELARGKYRISRELHADGGYHFHCFVDFETKHDFENVHRYCVGPPQTDPSRKCPVTTHCNILPVARTPFNTWDYVGKYGDIIAQTCDRPVARGANVTRDDWWTGSLAKSDKKTFHQDVKKHSPRDYVVFHRQIRGFADDTWGRDFEDPDLPTNEEDGVYIHWERYPEVRQWVLETFKDPIARIKSLSRGSSYPAETEEQDIAFLSGWTRRKRPKSLVVWGGSRLGKTIFATSLGGHIHWQRDFNLKRFMGMDQDRIEYAVFDDISWRNACFKGDGFKAWWGGNKRFDVSDKMIKKFTVHWGKPCIILSNRDPLESLDMEDRNWMEDNVIIVYLGNSDRQRENAIASADANAND